MADNNNGLPVRSLAGEFILAKGVDAGGTNQWAISAAGRLSVDASGVPVPITDNAGSLTVDGSVSITGSLPAGTNNIGDVDVLSIVPGTAATNLGKAVDSAVGATDTGVAALVVRDDALSTLTPVDGDYTNLRVNDQGALWVVSTGGPAGTEYTEGATDATITGTAFMWEDTADTLRPVSAATPLPITLVTAIPAGTNNIGDVDVLTLPNVTLASTTNTIEVVGDAAHDAAVAGNPLLMGAYASAAAPADVTADGDAVRVWALRNGSQVVNIAAGGTLWTNMGQTGATGQFVRLHDGTTMATVRDLAANDALNVAIVDGSGNQITTFGGGTQYAGDAAATATPTGTMAMGLANAAAPADVSANNDAVAMWMLRNGSPVMNLASGGTLVTVGQKTMTSSLPVVIASDQSAVTVAQATAANLNATVVQATAANLNAQVVGTAAQDAAISGNPLAMGARASTATPSAMTADGDSVYVWATRVGALVIDGGIAHDAAIGANQNPVLIGGRAQATAPTNVSADGDIVRAWYLQNGAAATVITAAGALIGGDATNGLDVDVTRVQGTVASNITQVGSANVSATAFLPVRLTDGSAYYTNTGQTAGTAPFTRITDATNTAAVIATINSLKVDASSIAGAVPSATNPLPVRLTDGTSFYATEGIPGTPTVSTVTSSALGAGAAVDLNHTLLAAGTTGHLMGVDIASTVPLKVEIKTVDGSDVATTRVVLFAPTYNGIQWRSPYKTFITRAGAAANARFRTTVTNKSDNVAADVYATAYFDII